MIYAFIANMIILTIFYTIKIIMVVVALFLLIYSFQSFILEFKLLSFFYKISFTEILLKFFANIISFFMIFLFIYFF